MENETANNITAFATFATAVVLVWQARDSRDKISVKISHPYNPYLMIEVYNHSGKKVTVNEVQFVFKKPFKLIPYHKENPWRFSSFSIETGGKNEVEYELTYPLGGTRTKVHDWRHLSRVKISLSTGKKFYFKIPAHVKNFLAANEEYFAGSSWIGHSQPSYGEFMKTRMN